MILFESTLCKLLCKIANVNISLPCVGEKGDLGIVLCFMWSSCLLGRKCFSLLLIVRVEFGFKVCRQSWIRILVGFF